MTSTRLPGKVLADLLGAPMLERQLNRLRRSNLVGEIVVATTTNATDDPVVALAERLELRSFRGSEHDVLSRYSDAAKMSDADVVVRVTADCPLLDAGVVDAVVAKLRDESADYASNVMTRSFPRGLDVEAFTRGALERADELATSAPSREHVTWFIHTERPELFRRCGVESLTDASDLRWTVDTDADLRMVRAVYEGLSLAHRYASFPEILAWVRANPKIARINADVEQKKVE
jgi:spore coat polysaccharide biosynthesis protein SpsF